MLTRETTETSDRTSSLAVAPSAARQHVDRLYAAERDLIVRRMALDDELAQAQEAAGDEALAAVMGEKRSERSLSRLGKLRDEMAALESAIEAARRQRLAAIPAIWRDEARDLRAQAATLQAEADQRQSRTDELLAALKEWEGCDYVPFVPDRSATVQLVGGPVTFVTIPTTMAMRNRIAQLERRADGLERREVVMDGAIEASSREDLFRKLFDHDPLEFAPHMFSALAWYDAAAEQERDRRVRVGTDLSRDVAVTMVWRAGEIQQDRSRVRVPARD